MDEIVKAAMAKWPNVPDCFGWLGLDARGNWHMRDDQAQAVGSFSSGLPGSKGALLQHERLIDFIQRNYAADALGQWFFQNGPQRVYVELQATPYIWRIGADFSVVAHTTEPARPRRCMLDELGRVYLETDLGFGLVHTQDVVLAAQAVEEGLWVPQEQDSHSLPQRFGYVMTPAVRGEPKLTK
jgi:hypothetical protein